jgi:hypothetical protein
MTAKTEEPKEKKQKGNSKTWKIDVFEADLE